MTNIAFRADGGPGIGMGHIMRCLSLAKEFKKANCYVCFFSILDEGINKIYQEGFDVFRLDSQNFNSAEVHDLSERSLEAEMDRITKLIGLNNIDIFIIDSYNVSLEYFHKFQSNQVKIGYIDDINSFIYPVDFLVNGNITGEYLNYTKSKDNELLLVGLQYNLIREEFKGIPKRNIRECVNSIMLTTGGTDPFNLNFKIAKILMNSKLFENTQLNIVVGNSFDNRKQLKQLSNEYKNIILYENVARISEIMLNSDIAISAGGSTLYELCACGTPTLAFIMADNQEFIVNKMHELNYVKSLGWFHNLTKLQLINELNSLCCDYEQRAQYSTKMQKLVDGLGTKRVVDKILESMN